jgi:hypothetical protein
MSPLMANSSPCCGLLGTCVRDSRYTPYGVVRSTDQREYRIARPHRGHALYNLRRGIGRAGGGIVPGGGFSARVLYG